MSKGYTLTPKRYFLVVSRHEPYKRIDLALRAFKKFLDSPPLNQKDRMKLVLVGKGTQKSKLSSLSAQLSLMHEVIWLQDLSDEDLAGLYSHAQALVMPQCEDFGYVACEALACGCPVVAYSKGGQAEIVEDGKTGILFEEQSVEALHRALVRMADFQYNLMSYENSHLRRGGRDTFMATLAQKISETVRESSRG